MIGKASFVKNDLMEKELIPMRWGLICGKWHCKRSHISLLSIGLSAPRYGVNVKFGDCGDGSLGWKMLEIVVDWWIYESRQEVLDEKATSGNWYDWPNVSRNRRRFKSKQSWTEVVKTQKVRRRLSIDRGRENH